MCVDCTDHHTYALVLDWWYVKKQPENWDSHVPMLCSMITYDDSYVLQWNTMLAHQNYISFAPALGRYSLPSTWNHSSHFLRGWREILTYSVALCLRYYLPDTHKPVLCSWYERSSIFIIYQNCKQKIFSFECGYSSSWLKLSAAYLDMIQFFRDG